MELIILLSAMVPVAVLIALPLILFRRKKFQLFATQWAKENGFELVKCEGKSFSPLTFSPTSALTQDVVLAVVKDSQGNYKKCLLKIETFSTGIFCFERKCELVEFV